MNAGGGDRARWAGSLAVALGAHLLLVGGGLWWAGRQAGPGGQQPMEALLVELADAPTSPPVPPTDLAPGPPRQEQAPQIVEPVRRQPEPRIELPVDIEPEVADPYRDAAEHESVAEQARDAVERSQAPPEVQAREASAYAGPHTISGARAGAVVTWQGLLLGHLERHRRYPRSAERARQQGVAYVRFAVDRQGRVSGERISRSSGHRQLDEEALATVRRGSPVPAPPAEIKGDPVEVMVPVSFFIRAGAAADR